MDLLHSSSRGSNAVRPSEYDHEIKLIDHTIRPTSPDSEIPSSPDGSPSASRHDSNVPLQQKRSLRSEMARRKYAKYQDRRLEDHTESDITDDEQPTTKGVAAEDGDNGEEERGRPKTAGSRKPRKQERETAIDILYENQRGGFLCGCIPLFSGKALGNLDPASWTNSAQKKSLTNITNAQCPDPSWQWVWKEWSINRTDAVDEDGWEYSFMFSKKFSWHGPSWWNSCVRRRAWIRKRALKPDVDDPNQEHLLDDDYFTIHPAAEPRRRSLTSPGRDGGKHRYSINQLAIQKMEDESELEDICDISALMRYLRASRIDREKMEVVENFIANGGEELYYLQDHMHEIMGMFTFQASRRLLLAHLYKKFDEASSKQNGNDKGKENADPVLAKRLKNLEAAVKHADEEVQRLEYWSDVKEMAEQGQTIGAVDEAKGWDHTWHGLDNSAPKDVLTEEKLPGKADCPSDEEGNSMAIKSSISSGQKHTPKANGTSRSASPDRKGKGKAGN